MTDTRFLVGDESESSSNWWDRIRTEKSIARLNPGDPQDYETIRAHLETVAPASMRFTGANGWLQIGYQGPWVRLVDLPQELAQRVLEKSAVAKMERQHAETLARAAEVIQAEESWARQEALKREMMEWIATYGSDTLRRTVTKNAVDLGLYVTERSTKELGPGWFQPHGCEVHLREPETDEEMAALCSAEEQFKGAIGVADVATFEDIDRYDIPPIRSALVMDAPWDYGLRLIKFIRRKAFEP